MEWTPGLVLALVDRMSRVDGSPRPCLFKSLSTGRFLLIVNDTNFEKVLEGYLRRQDLVVPVLLAVGMLELEDEETDPQPSLRVTELGSRHVEEMSFDVELELTLGEYPWGGRPDCS